VDISATSVIPLEVHPQHHYFRLKLNRSDTVPALSNYKIFSVILGYSRYKWTDLPMLSNFLLDIIETGLSVGSGGGTGRRQGPVKKTKLRNRLET